MCPGKLRYVQVIKVEQISERLAEVKRSYHAFGEEPEEASTAGWAAGHPCFCHRMSLLPRANMDSF